MTEYGTIKLDQLDYLPCNCDICSKYQSKELKEIPFEERVKLLAKHNLHVCLEEIQRIKQAIKEGRLWELLELRARSHPSLLQALRELDKHKEFLEEFSPASKERGLFYFGSTGLARPEVTRYRKRLLERYTAPIDSEVLILLPQTRTKPFHRSREIKRVLNKINHVIGEKAFRLHVCVIAAPFGVIPLEIDELYPLSQFEIALPPDNETLDYVSKQVSEYVSTHKYRVIILHNDPKLIGDDAINACKKTCEALGIKFLASATDDKPWGKNALNSLIEIVSNVI
jgi:7-cyano-7-deazaguanine tRNA-ribosyltransferase